MSEDKHGDFVIPALLTAAAVYFGIKKKSRTLRNITKQAVDMVIDNEVNDVEPQVKVHNAPKLLLTNSSNHKRNRRRR